MGYFTTTINPTITASLQHAHAFTDADLLFDWTAFNVPKGANKLMNVTALIRGTDGSPQTFAMDLFFAKTFQGSAPGSLGTISATAGGIGYYNHLIGAWKIEELDYINTGQLDTGPNISTLSHDSRTANFSNSVPPIVLQGEPESGSNVGYDKLYVAATTPDGACDFSTAVVTSQVVDVSGLSAAQLVNADIEGTDPRSVFAPGDIIHAEDGIILGEIESMADANTITFKTDGSKQEHAGGETLFSNASGLTNWKIQNGAGAAGDLASGDELYNLHPITLILSWER